MNTNKFCLTLMIAFGGICWTLPARSQSVQFVPAPGSPIRVGPKSGRIVLADVNRDGHLDLLTQHLLQNRISVQLGDGVGHFVPDAARSLSLDYRPESMAAADINNDGIPDLAIGTKVGDQESVRIFLGTADGFNPAPGSPLNVSNVAGRGNKPNLRLIDFNGDRNLDIISESGRRNTVDLFTGDGRGGFVRGPDINLKSGQNFSAAGFGDLNGDGRADLVSLSDGTPDEGCVVAVNFGDGNGAFTASTAKGATVPIRAVVQLIADLNGDERPDLVLKHGERKLFTILLNEGQGRFVTAAGSPQRFERGAFAVVAADVNRDRHTDLVVATANNQADPFESRIVVLLGNDDGFSPAPGLWFEAGPGAYNLAVGDVNGDAKPDIAASSSAGDAVTLLLGQ